MQNEAVFDHLTALGLSPAGEVPVMTVRTEALAAIAPVEGLTISEARTPEEFRLWGEIGGRGTDFPEAACIALGEAEASIAPRARTGQIRLIGWRNGAPVATAAAVVGPDSVGIYAVSTLPEERRKGLGTALTVAAIEAAGRPPIALLQSSSMGRPIYEKLGFREVGRYRLFAQS